MNIFSALSAAWRGKEASRVDTGSPLVIRPRPDVAVIPPPRFAWDEKGWKRSVEHDAVRYHGQFRVYDLRRAQWRFFDGQIADSHGKILAFIHDPAPELARHPKAACFTLTKQPPWFQVHWRYAPKTIDDVVIYVERVLDECLNRGRA